MATTTTTPVLRFAQGTTFYTIYSRNNKKNGCKNLRCFPDHNPKKHISAHTCSRPIDITATGDIDFVVGVLSLGTNPVYKVGDVRNVDGFIGPDHYYAQRGDNGYFRLLPKVWGYSFRSGKQDSNKFHVLTLYALKETEPGRQTVIAELKSSQFRICSKRRTIEEEEKGIVVVGSEGVAPPPPPPPKATVPKPTKSGKPRKKRTKRVATSSSSSSSEDDDDELELHDDDDEEEEQQEQEEEEEIGLTRTPTPTEPRLSDIYNDVPDDVLNSVAFHETWEQLACSTRDSFPFDGMTDIHFPSPSRASVSSYQPQPPQEHPRPSQPPPLPLVFPACSVSPALLTLGQPRKKRTFRFDLEPQL